MAALQQIYDELLARPPKRRMGRLHWPAVQGLYFWGGVGRGKTWLMDAFYESLPFTRKYRTHFHRFMLEVQERRKAHKHEQDPLKLIAADIARDYRVLCFDEFFVSDIADAMILGRLTTALFKHGVTLVTTSNIEPDGLYKDGLQRQNFLPAIASLNQHCRVLQVEGGVDYRLRTLERARVYHFPLSVDLDAHMLDSFKRLSGGSGQFDTALELHGRSIPARALADGVAWFDYQALCTGPRGSADYTELARRYHSLILTGVPQFTRETENEARRFITLVDEFYDHSVKLILTAAVARDALYAGKRLCFEFARTHSRLVEMGTREYLARPHHS